MCCEQNTVYREILPPFYFCPLHPHCQQVSSNVLKYFSLNTAMSEQIQDGVKLFVSEEWRK